MSWLFGVNELIRIGREQNHLLSELIAIQNEQQELFQALFIENSVTEEDNDAAESENNENLEDSEEKSEKKIRDESLIFYCEFLRGSCQSAIQTPSSFS